MEDSGETWRASEIREKNAAEVDCIRLGGLKGSKSFGYVCDQDHRHLRRNGNSRLMRYCSK